MEDILKLKAQLEAERAKILKRTAHLHEERDALIAQIQPMEEKAKELAKQFIAIERPRLPQIDTQLAQIARMTGAKTLSGK